jgi:hypothetical protein
MFMTAQPRAQVALALRRGASIAQRPAKRSGVAPVALAAIGVGALSTTLVLPLGLVALIVATGLIALVAARTSTVSLRDAIAAERLAGVMRARRARREDRLPAASFGRQTLAELTRLVDFITAHDPDLAARVDLEALLDRHVTLTIAHDRALDAAQMADRVQLERIRDNLRGDSRANPKRLEMCERRLRSLDQCEARAEGFADELAILSDLIALIAQRVACPEDPVKDDAIERQLAELDDTDAARRQLAELP